MKLNELIEEGFEDAGVGSFKGLGSLEIFSQVKRIIDYSSEIIENLENAPDFSGKLEYLEELNETLYSIGQFICETYCDRKFKSSSKILFERVEEYMLTIKDLLGSEYEVNLGLFISSLEDKYKRKKKNICLFKGNRISWK